MIDMLDSMRRQSAQHMFEQRVQVLKLRYPEQLWEMVPSKVARDEAGKVKPLDAPPRAAEGVTREQSLAKAGAPKALVSADPAAPAAPMPSAAPPAAAAVDPELVSCLAALSLSRLESCFLGETAAALKVLPRADLLKQLKTLGVEKLTERQKLATAIAKLDGSLGAASRAAYVGQIPWVPPTAEQLERLPKPCGPLKQALGYTKKELGEIMARRPEGSSPRLPQCMHRSPLRGHAWPCLVHTDGATTMVCAAGEHFGLPFPRTPHELREMGPLLRLTHLARPPTA
jgi:hypothetical protein